MTDNVKILGWLMAAFVLVIFHSCIDQKKQTAQTNKAEYLNPLPVQTNESVVAAPIADRRAEQLVLQQQLLKDYEELQKILESAQ